MSGVETWRRWTCIAAACGSGLSGGVFLAYSSFTMSGLRQLAPAQGLQAMQAINRSAERSAWLMTTLLGTAALCLVVGIAAIRDRSPASTVQLVAGAIYLVAVIVMTVAFHVPRNDALATVDPTTAGAARSWLDYARVWTAGNHVRTLASFAASALYTWSLTSGRPAT